MSQARKRPRLSFDLPVPGEVALATMRSHGWFDLLPFQFDPHRAELRYAASCGGRTVSVTLRAKGKRLLVDVNKGSKAAASALASRILGLDWDLAGFHREIAHEADLRWIAEGGHGRLLRSATLFEDLLKALFTTNTTWDRTKRMNDELVRQFGTTGGSSPSFPHPRDIAGIDEQTLQGLIGCGYRARSVLAIAERALEEPDTFLGAGWTALNPPDFKNLVLGCHGIGPVSANYICCVYGRCSGFAVDAYVSRRLRELWGGSKAGTEKRLRQMQASHGDKAPLLLWLTITRHWHETPNALP